MDQDAIGVVPELRDVFAGYFRIGAAVNPRTLVSSADLLARHFNCITAENEMKFERIHPHEETYAFEDADRLAGFAREHGMKMRGHTLVWHNQTPDWLFEKPGGGLADKALLYARLKAHIDTVVGRYKSDVFCWDVVNEAVADEGSELLRESKWLRIAGEEFIAKAFEFAHDADPDALLFYNDYNESHPAKREKIVTLVRSLKARGVPIHGVGLQAHWQLRSPPADDIRAAIERYASLGLKLHITELDVSVFEWDDRRADLKSPTAEMMELQERRYEQIFRIFREYSDVIECVTFWGVADDYTWLDHFPVRGRKNWPFLFDERHQPKPSFWKVVNGAGTQE